MRRNTITTIIFGIGLSIVSQAVAFQSDYISVEEKGNGPNVILIHGFACSPEVWSGLAREIDSKFKLHIVTIAGLAGSPAPKDDTESYLKTLRDEIARYIDTEELKKVTLIGHSMGGLTSLLVASKERSQVEKVIVVDALPFFSLIFNPLASSEQVLPQAKAFEKQLIGLNDEQFELQAKSAVSRLTKSDDKKELLVKWSKESDRKVYARYLREVMAYDARPELKTIMCPVTVLYPYDQAMGIPEVQVKFLYSNAYVNLKTVSIQSVPDSFHFIMWDQPKVFYSMVEGLIISASAVQLKN